MSRAALLLVGALSSCVSPEYGPWPALLCKQSHVCPHGYRCVDGWCRSAGAEPADAAPGPAEVAAGPDGGSAQVPGTWVKIAAGSFTMGSPSDEPCRQSDETQHPVTLTRAFEITAHEVTAAQFLAVLGYQPAAAGCPGCPAVGEDQVAALGAADQERAAGDVHLQPARGSLHDAQARELEHQSAGLC